MEAIGAVIEDAPAIRRIVAEVGGDGLNEPRWCTGFEVQDAESPRLRRLVHLKEDRLAVAGPVGVEFVGLSRCQT